MGWEEGEHQGIKVCYLSTNASSWLKEYLKNIAFFLYILWSEGLAFSIHFDCFCLFFWDYYNNFPPISLNSRPSASISSVYSVQINFLKIPFFITGSGCSIPLIPTQPTLDTSGCFSSSPKSGSGLFCQPYLLFLVHVKQVYSQFQPLLQHSSILECPPQPSLLTQILLIFEDQRPTLLRPAFAGGMLEPAPTGSGELIRMSSQLKVLWCHVVTRNQWWWESSYHRNWQMLQSGLCPTRELVVKHLTSRRCLTFLQVKNPMLLCNLMTLPLTWPLKPTYSFKKSIFHLYVIRYICTFSK